MGRGSSGLGNSEGKPNSATEEYVSGDGMWINQYLRGRGDFGELSDGEKQFVRDLDKATNGKISDDTLYRSVDAEAVFGKMSDTEYDNLRQAVIYGEDSFGKGKYADNVRKSVNNRINNTVDKTITEKGYMSTTTSERVAQDWGGFTGSDKPIIMKIKPSRNTRGVNLSQYDRNVPASSAQHERLLARNQSYTVQRVYSRNGEIYVDVKMR